MSGQTESEIVLENDAVDVPEGERARAEVIKEEEEDKNKRKRKKAVARGGDGIPDGNKGYIYILQHGEISQFSKHLFSCLFHLAILHTV